MTAPTTSVRWLLARAAVRTTGVLHVVSQRDTGALNPVCGANPIRSTRIEQHATVPADVPVCGDCTAIAARLGGVGALVGGTAAATLLEVPVARVEVPASHVRSVVNTDVTELTVSVSEHGVLVPILVRATDTGYTLVAGARRLAAARAAGLPTVPAVVDVRGEDPRILALVENLHRADLNPIDQATAYAGLLESMTAADVARRVGVSRPQVANTVRLLGLPAEIRAQVASGAISAQHARALLRITDPVEQAALAQQIADGMTARDAEDAARSASTRSAAKPAKPVQLVDVAGAITAVLGARTRVTDKRITIDVADPADLQRILAHLGITATTVQEDAA